MNVERYTPEAYPMICLWYKERNLETPGKDRLPPTGFVVENVAAGFLYHTDAPLCFIEHFISNPKVSKEIRDRALDEIVENLLLEAKGNTVVSYSDLQVIIDRARKHSFTIYPQQFTMIAR